MSGEIVGAAPVMLLFEGRVNWSAFAVPPVAKPGTPRAETDISRAPSYCKTFPVTFSVSLSLG